MAVLLTDWVDQ